MRRTFSFDGWGINGPDEYRTRLATFTEAGKAYPGLRNLLEAAPELLAALEDIVNFVAPRADDVPFIAMLEDARAAIAKAKGAA